MAVRQRRVPGPVGRALMCVALAAVSLGCATGIVSRGRLLPDRFAEVLARTERARMIAVKGEINAFVVSRRDLDGIVRDAVLAQWQPDEFDRYQAGLVAVGLWPVDRDLMAEYVGAMGEEAAGLYVPWDRTIYVVSNPSIPFSLRWSQMLARRDVVREMVLSHELVHLLQHQNYPHLMGLDPSFKEQDDVGYALQAAVEGDAFRYGLEALELLPVLPDPADFEREFEAQLGEGALADAPALIRLAVMLPYTRGYRLSYQEATALLDAPPASTEQTLHPGKRREPFLAFDLSELRYALPAGCRFVYENTVGELALSALMSDWSDPAHPEVGEGWDGDRYLVARCQGRLGLLWISSWDTEADAREFAVAYARIAGEVAAAAGLDSVPRVTLRSHQVLVATERLAAHTDALSRARRQRVATLEELFDFMGRPRRWRSAVGR